MRLASWVWVSGLLQASCTAAVPRPTRLPPQTPHLPSKYGCQWDAPCRGCAAGSDLVARATAAIRAVEPGALISVNGMGQDGAGGGCGRGGYDGLNWGDGFITQKKAVTKLGLSDPSFLFRWVQ